MAASSRWIQLALEGGEHHGTAMGEPFRHHPDHLARLTVEDQFPADHGWVACKVFGPEVVGQHDDLRTSRLILDLCVPAADLWPYAEHVAKRRRRRHRPD